MCATVGSDEVGIDGAATRTALENRIEPSRTSGRVYINVSSAVPGISLKFEF